VAAPLPDATPIIEALGRSGMRAVLVATGGGARAISHLVGTPGASDVVVEGLVPYAREAIDRLLGGPQESYCSSRTARRLAVAAWQRARDCGVPAAAALGVAVTASLKTRQPKRGDHRLCVAIQSLGATATAELTLDKDARSRDEEEAVTATIVLGELLAACTGAEPATAAVLRPGEGVTRRRCDPPPAWRDLFAGERSAARADASAEAADARTGRLVFPGSFDPLHEGHRLMARIAAEIAERPVECELSITNVDKPALDYLEIRDRAAQFADQPLWLSRAARFLEKLDVFPGSTFVMGADTYVRLADARYYGGSEARADEAVRAIAARAAGLIVFGRATRGEFQEASRLDIPQALRDITYFVSQREFRLDVSSTELRRRQAEAAEPPSAD
jgi:nicotinic acid mononucleotide adenylyltransferase/nicotinamide mononucleotide (NMN) deamidase PncC